MTTMTTQSVSVAVPTAWQLTGSKSKTFDSDAVIDAYLAGRRDGFNHEMNEMHRAVTELLKNNAATVAARTLTIFDFLKSQDVVPVNAYLKVSSFDELDVLVLIKEEDFLKPSFKEVYKQVYDIEELSEQENISLDFCFTPVNECFSEAKINADGFNLELKGSANKAV